MIYSEKTTKFQEISFKNFDVMLQVMSKLRGTFLQMWPSHVTNWVTNVNLGVGRWLKRAQNLVNVVSEWPLGIHNNDVGGSSFHYLLRRTDRRVYFAYYGSKIFNFV